MKKIFAFYFLCLSLASCTNKPSVDNAIASLKRNFGNNIDADFKYINGIKSENKKVEYYKMYFDATIKFINDWNDDSPMYRGKLYKKGDVYKIDYAYIDFMLTDNDWIATTINFKEPNGFVKIGKQTETMEVRDNVPTTDTKDKIQITLSNYLSKNSVYHQIPEAWFEKRAFESAKKEWGFGTGFNPYYQTGDFNNDGIKDFASVLMNGNGFNDKKCRLQIAIFNGTGDNYKVSHVEYLKYSDFNNEFYIGQQNGTLYYSIMETDIVESFKSTGIGYRLSPE